jgi:hypothetical protein
MSLELAKDTSVVPLGHPLRDAVAAATGTARNVATADSATGTVPLGLPRGQLARRAWSASRTAGHSSASTLNRTVSRTVPSGRRW